MLAQVDKVIQAVAALQHPLRLVRAAELVDLVLLEFLLVHLVEQDIHGPILASLMLQAADGAAFSTLLWHQEVEVSVDHRRGHIVDHLEALEQVAAVAAVAVRQVLLQQAEAEAVQVAVALSS